MSFALDEVKEKEQVKNEIRSIENTFLGPTLLPGVPCLQTKNLDDIRVPRKALLDQKCGLFSQPIPKCQASSGSSHAKGRCVAQSDMLYQSLSCP